MKTLLKHYDFTKKQSLDDWTIAVGEKWANHELQQYVNDKDHLYFDDGLVLKATYEDGIYKSARLHTKGQFSFRYGRVDIIAKIPSGQGTWPALWMMSESQPYGRWPKSGEIDIMEHSHNNFETIFYAIHTEQYNHKRKQQYYAVKHLDGLTNDFHKFSVDWKEDSITYYLDDEKVACHKKGQDGFDTSPKGWPFDSKFYLIMNLAIGGTFGGEVDPTCFPQMFIIKDIKIYQ